jgi:hypothetical protein
VSDAIPTGDALREAFLKALLARVKSGEATAADLAVALKTLDQMKVDLAKGSGKAALDALGKASVVEGLPFPTENTESAPWQH